MSDGTFDEIRPGVPRVSPLRPPEPGDKVRIRSGRHRDAKGILRSIVTTPTPSGSSVIVAWVERPRAGLTPVFMHDVERAE